MSVKIISEEKIRPSSPTPETQKHLKFSFLDQLALPVYVPVLLFYAPGSDDNQTSKSHRLKASLSKALAQSIHSLAEFKAIMFQSIATTREPSMWKPKSTAFSPTSSINSTSTHSTNSSLSPSHPPTLPKAAFCLSKPRRSNAVA